MMLKFITHLATHLAYVAHQIYALITYLVDKVDRIAPVAGIDIEPEEDFNYNGGYLARILKMSKLRI